MSGLELAAGVIAVVQVTGQAAVLTTQIKKLWGGVRDAPEDIQDLVDEIELTSLLLQDIERQLADSGAPVEAWDSPATQSVFQHTRRAHLALQGAAELLEGEIQRSQSKGRRLIASTKAVLKKPVLDRLKAKLEFSLKLLQLSTQLQTAAVVARATSVIFERLPKRLPEVPSNVPSAGTSEDDSTPDESPETPDSNIQVTCHEITSPRLRSKGFNTLRARDWTWMGRFDFRFTSREECWLSIQPPSWLARTTHVILANKSVAGPQLSLRRYETIAGWEIDVMNIVERDDWPALEMYLNTTGISPFAVNPRGNSLLFLACVFGSINLVKALLQLGLGVFTESIEDHPDSTLLIEAWQSLVLQQGPYDRSGVVPRLEILRLLLAHGLAALAGNMYHLIGAMRGMPDIPSNVRLQMACCVLLQFGHNDIGNLLPELRTPSPTSCASTSCIRDSPLIHFLVFAVARQSSGFSTLSRQEPQLQALLRWITRCTEIDPEGLHRRISVFEGWGATRSPVAFVIGCFQDATPLWMLIVNFALEAIDRTVWHLDFIVHVDRLHSVFYLFLWSLRDAGHDLRMFGRKERQLSKNGVAFSRVVIGLFKLYGNQVRTQKAMRIWWTRFRVFGMTFGSRVEDWVIWWAWEYEHLAKEFWDMVENPPCHLPGSWVDLEYDCEWESLREYCELDDQTSFIWSEV